MKTMAVGALLIVALAGCNTLGKIEDRIDGIRDKISNVEVDVAQVDRNADGKISGDELLPWLAGLLGLGGVTSVGLSRRIAATREEFKLRQPPPPV